MTAEQRLLTIDCGNSTIRVRRADGAIWTTASAAPDFDGLEAFVSCVPAPGAEALAVSVVPAALAATRAAFSALRVPLAVAGEDLACPLALAYETVDTLGADRWLGAFAAHLRHGAAVTVDCGSATTVNVVTADGTFLGGAIAPGLTACVAGMQACTPALPAASLDADVRLPGASTQQSVDVGVVLGWVGMVERLVDGMRERVPDATVVLTGGNARRLLRHGRLAGEHVPELLHDGLRALAARRR